jgi:fibronectin type 3 domain-containing protein
MYKKKLSFFLLFFFVFSIFPLNMVRVLADVLGVSTALAASPVNQYSGPIVNLSWAADTNALSYNVYRSEDGGNNFTKVGSSTVNAYKDDTVALDKDYYYQVTAVSSSGESERSEMTTAKVYTPIKKFDVGQNNVETGYTLVGNGYGGVTTTMYSDELGYGFTKTANGRDRGNYNSTTPANAVYRDYAFVDGNSFKVKLPIGKYVINMICGSTNTDSGSSTNVFVGGKQVLTVSFGKGAVNEGAFVTSVINGDPLEMSFTGGSNAKVNGIIITPLSYGPTNLTASEINVTSTPAYASLSWNAAQDSISYNVYRKANGDNEYTKVGTTKELSFKDENVFVGKTYSYYVTNITVNGEGQSVVLSDVKVIDTTVAVPSAPAGFKADRQPSSASLTWSKDESVLFYNIYRKTAVENEYKIIGSVDKSSSPSYIDENLIGYMNYHYKITAVNKGGESAASSADALAKIPAVPGDVIVEKAGWSVVEVLSTTTDEAIGAKVYRAEAIGGEYNLLGDAQKINNTYRYKDTGLTPEKEYFYKFTAYNYTGESEKTAPAKVKTKPVIQKPDAPETIELNSIVMSGTNYKVRVDWKYSYGAISYNIYRSTTSTTSGFTKIGSSTNGVYYDTTSGTANALYYYKVTAVNGSGESDASEVVTVKLTSNFRPVPAGLTVTSQDSALNLSWTAVDGANSYNIYRTLKGDNVYSKIATSNAAAYVDSSAVLGNSYEYKITSVDVNGESLKTSAVEGSLVDTNIAKLDAVVTGAAYSYNEGGALKINWNSVEGATSYNVYKSSSKDTKYHFVGNVNSNEFVYADNNEAGTYYYKITSLNAGGESSKSEALTVLPKVTLKRQMENINRGINAVKASNGILVSWRFLGTDPENIGFNVYRDGIKINSALITTSTNYLDAAGTKNSKYYVTAVVNNEVIETSQTITPWENNFKDIPIKKPAPGITKAGEIYDYAANDSSVADLDGDGEYEIVVNWQPTNAKDNSTSGYTGNTYIDAYKLDGTFMWRIDLGKNIRSGAHYTDIMVYDFDGDGKAEVTMKTADGTIDGVGNIIGDEDKDYRNTSGYILDGPEYHTMFEGTTGKALATEIYEPQRGAVTADTNEWGDTYGNRVDRFIAGIAYLDGKTPSIIMQRGYYTRMVISAYGWKDGKFVKQWTFDTSYDEVDPNGLPYKSYMGQGNHQISIADVDGDGFDEVITGAAVIDNDGKALYTTGLGHGDAMHVGDLDPSRPGLEIYQVQENAGAAYGMDIRDAGTGEILFGVKTGIDTGRGLSADIDPRYLGEEIWAIDGEWNSTTGGLYSVKGEKIANNIPTSNFAIWWDGDLQRELLDHNWVGYTTPPTPAPGRIDKWDYVNNRLVNLLTAEGTSSNNGTKGNPAIQADLFGDWREEVIWRLADSSALRIYATTDATENRIYTLMHDPVYRLGVAWQNTGYNQPPHTSFYLGTGMTTPPQPNITMKAGGEEVVIDRVAPEVSVSFDKRSLDMVLGSNEEGAEISFKVLPGKESGMTGNGEAEIREYVLEDAAGNTTIMNAKYNRLNNLVKVELLDIKYNDGETIVLPANKIHFNYVAEKDGSIKILKQQIELKDQLIEAEYNSKKDETVIITQLEGQEATQEVRKGLVFLQILTDNGRLSIK